MAQTVISSVSLPASLAKELAKIAKSEHRTRSGIIQEAARFYLETRRWRHLQHAMQVRVRSLGLGGDADIEALVDELRK
jgi:metal-responsive CopG/Arc/MetJ family transcriptional regulator